MNNDKPESKKRTVSLIRRVKRTQKREVFLTKTQEQASVDNSDKLLQPFRGNSFLQPNNAKYGLLPDLVDVQIQKNASVKEMVATQAMPGDSFYQEDSFNSSLDSMSQTLPTSVSKSQQRTLVRWKKRQKEWNNVKTILCNKLDTDKQCLLMSKTNEYLERIQEIDATQASIPLNERCGLNYWEISLRGGGPMYVPIGNIFSGLFCPVTFEPPKPRRKLRSRVPWMSASCKDELSHISRPVSREEEKEVITNVEVQMKNDRPHTAQVPVIVLYCHSDMLFSTSSPTKTSYSSVKMENKSDIVLHFNAVATTQVDAILFSCQPKRGFIPPNGSIDLQVMFHPAKAGCWYGSLSFSVSPLAVMRLNFTDMGKMQDIILHPTKITLRGIATEESFDRHCIEDLNERFVSDMQTDVASSEVNMLLSSIVTPRYADRKRVIQQERFESSNAAIGLWFSEGLYDKLWLIREAMINRRESNEISQDEFFNDDWNGDVCQLLNLVQAEHGSSDSESFLFQIKSSVMQAMIHPHLLATLKNDARSSNVSALLSTLLVDAFDIFAVEKTKALNAMKNASAKLPAKGAKIVKSNTNLQDAAVSDNGPSLTELARKKEKSVIQLWSEDIQASDTQLTSEAPYYQALYDSLRPSVEQSLVADFDQIYKSLAVQLRKQPNLKRNVMANPIEFRGKVLVLHYDLGSAIRVEDSEQIMSDITMTSRHQPKLTIITVSFLHSVSMKAFSKGIKQQLGKAFAVVYCESIPKLIAEVKRKTLSESSETKIKNQVLVMESLSCNEIMPAAPIAEVQQEDDDIERIVIGCEMPVAKVESVSINVDLGKGVSTVVNCNLNLSQCLKEIADVVVLASSTDLTSTCPYWRNSDLPLYGGIGFQSELEAINIISSMDCNKKSVAIIGGDNFQATIPLLVKAISSMSTVIILGAVCHPFLVNAYRHASWMRQHPSYDCCNEHMARFLSLLALQLGCSLISPEDVAGCSTKLDKFALRSLLESKESDGKTVASFTFDIDDEITCLSEPFTLATSSDVQFFAYEVGPTTIARIGDIIKTSSLIWVHNMPALAECNQYQQSTQTIFTTALTRAMNAESVVIFSGEDVSTWCSKISSENGLDLFEEGHNALIKPRPGQLYILPRVDMMKLLTTRSESLAASRLQSISEGHNLQEFIKLQDDQEEKQDDEEEDEENK